MDSTDSLLSMCSHGERNGIERTMRLPPELEGLIISHIRDDKTALAICSLVNGSWLQQCRRFLFEAIVVKATSQADLLSFLDLLGTARYALESVQTLTLHASPTGSSSDNWASWEAVRQGWSAVDRQFLRAVAAKVPNLKRLRLTY